MTEAKKEYHCTIESFDSDQVCLHILYAQEPDYELSGRIYLFQGLPKAEQDGTDHSEGSGARRFTEIIPVETRRCAVRLDGKKAAKKTERWNQIAQSAAKQSKRMLIPEVHSVMTYKEALHYAETLDVKLIPYELAEGMKDTKNLISQIRPGSPLVFYPGRRI